MTGAALLLAAAALWAAAAEEPGEEVRVRSKGPSGPGVIAPSPGSARREAADEVIRSLDLYKTERRPGTVRRRLPAGGERFRGPFPRPPFLSLDPAAIAADYDRWTFELLEAGRVVWKTAGLGRLLDPILWDGSGLVTGDGSARLMEPYSFRFTAEGPAPFVLESEEVTLTSLAVQDTLGGTRLEVAAAALFPPKGSAFKDEAGALLAAVAERLRRLHAPGDLYRLALHSGAPSSPLWERRAKALQRRLASALVVDPRRVEVSLHPAGLRGEVLACELPPEVGSRLGGD